MNFYIHLISRGWSTHIRSWVDWDNQLITFPLWTLNGKLVGYQKYNWKEQSKRYNAGRYYTYISEGHKQCSCYGLDNCKNRNILFIVEGIWDALRVNQCGYDCLAMLCATPHKQLKWWVKQYANTKPIIALCDNDKNHTGKKLGGWTDYSWVIPAPHKDVGDMFVVECSDFLLTNLKSVI